MQADEDLHAVSSWCLCSLSTRVHHVCVLLSIGASLVVALVTLFLLVTSVLTNFPSLPDVRCEKPEVENAKNLNSFATEYTYGEKVSFECAPGHALSGAQTVTCDADNTWKPSLPSCDPREYRQTFFLKQLP